MTRTVAVEVKPPRFMLYFVVSVVICVLGFGSAHFYNILAGPIEGANAPAQLGQQGETANLVSRGLAMTDIQGTIKTVTLFVVVLLWMVFAWRYYRYSKAGTASLILLCLFFTGCGPVKLEQFVDIQDHETAFVIPLEGGNENQEKFQSKEFLEKSMIAAKRISLPLRTRSTGRMPWDYEYIPTARVVKASRTPESRVWYSSTPEADKSSQALRAQSAEGIKFTTGAVICALVLEEDAALFRSHFKDVPLSQILDSTVRGYCQEKLASEFGKRSLDQCQKEKSLAYEATEKAAIEKFKEYGITILYFGNQNGLTYINDKVQQAIDAEYLQKLKRQIADRKLIAQQTRNETQRIVAKAEAEASKKLQDAADAMQFITMLDIAKMQAEARLEMAKRVSGKLPETILPSNANEGSSMLLNLNK
jgi:hypothetical protein